MWVVCYLDYQRQFFLRSVSSCIDIDMGVTKCRVAMPLPSFLQAFVILVTCLLEKPVLCDITDVRLVGGTSAQEGTVQVYVDGGWIDVCGNSIAAFEGAIICRHQHFAGLNRIFSSTPFPYSPQGSASPIILQCDREDGLFSCQYFTSGCPDMTFGAAKCFGENYLGCYQDERNDRLFTAQPLVDPAMTTEMCLILCAHSTGGDLYAYAGLEFGTECFCGKEEEDYRRHGTDDGEACQTQCGGSALDSCGGTGYIAVFRIRLDATTENPMTMPNVPTGRILTVPRGATATNMRADTKFEANIGAYAGAGVGALVVLILIIIIITLVCFIKRRSGTPKKNATKSEDVFGRHPPPLPEVETGEENKAFYHEVAATGKAEPSGGENFPHLSDQGAIYYEANLYSNPGTKQGDVPETLTSTGKEDATPVSQQSAAQDGSRADGGISRLYAKPVKDAVDGSKRDSRQASVRYAKVDKGGRSASGQEEWIDCEVYGMAEDSDDPRPDPEGGATYEQVNDLEPGGNRESEEAVDEGLYATSTDGAIKPTVNSDGQCGTVMVDNELYGQ